VLTLATGRARAAAVESDRRMAAGGPRPFGGRGLRGEGRDRRPGCTPLTVSPCSPIAFQRRTPRQWSGSPRRGVPVAKVQTLDFAFSDSLTWARYGTPQGLERIPRSPPKGLPRSRAR
jgi:hypothetical protein